MKQAIAVLSIWKAFSEKNYPLLIWMFWNGLWAAQIV